MPVAHGRAAGRLDDLQRRCAPLAFGYAVVRKYLDDGGAREAALITYYGFLSLFPVLLLGVAVVSRIFINSPGLSQDVVAAIVPPSLHADVADSVAALSRSRAALIAGLIGLAYSGAGVVFSAYVTLNHLAAVPFRNRRGVVSRLLRVLAGLAVILAGAIAAGVLTVAIATTPHGLSRALGLAASCLVSGVLLTVLARLLLDRPAPLRSLWPAALTGALAVTTTLNVGAVLLPRLVRGAGPVYGGFATVAGVFTLLYVLSNVLVLAAEAAAVRHGRLWPRAFGADRPTTADRRALALLTREQDRRPRTRRVPGRRGSSGSPRPDEGPPGGLTHPRIDGRPILGGAMPSTFVRLTHDTAEATASGIYGVIVCAAMLVTSHAERAWQEALAVLVTLTIYWVAERYARILADRIHEGHRLTWQTVRHQLTSGWEIVTASALPLLVLVLTRLAGVRLETAEFAALGCATALLCAAGWRMGAAGRLTTAERLVSTVTAGAFGAAMILLKTLLH